MLKTIEELGSFPVENVSEVVSDRLRGYRILLLLTRMWKDFQDNGRKRTWHGSQFETSLSNMCTSRRLPGIT